jgi:hypothetical protein
MHELATIGYTTIYRWAITSGGTMSGINQCFVRNVTDEAIAAVRAMFPSSELETNAEFTRVLTATLLEQALRELSARLQTDVMWIAYQSVTDFFEYYHWRAGDLFRALVYGHYVERTWERVEGQAEAWEREYFFAPQELAAMIEDEQDLDEQDRWSEAEIQRLKEFWQAGELVAGERMPMLGAQRCAFHLATYYRFPGWDAK